MKSWSAKRHIEHDLKQLENTAEESPYLKLKEDGINLTALPIFMAPDEALKLLHDEFRRGKIFAFRWALQYIKDAESEANPTQKDKP